MLIAWNEYSANLSGATYKMVECEECNQKYVYQMVRTGEGRGNSLYFLDNAGARRRAQGQAKAVLEHKLKKECDAVPCPKCGWYQEQMVVKMRNEYRLWLWYTGLVVAFAGAVCGTLGLAYAAFDVTMRPLGVGFLALGLTAFASGIGCIVWRMRLAAQFDPNDSTAKERLEIAAARAQKVKNFEKWLIENGVDMQTAESV
jgi:hypothetical protein